MDLKDFENPSFNLDITKLLQMILQTTTKNSIMLEAIIEGQIVLEKKLQGQEASKEDEEVLNRLNTVLIDVEDESRKIYLEIIKKAII